MHVHETQGSFAVIIVSLLESCMTMTCHVLGIIIVTL